MGLFDAFAGLQEMAEKNAPFIKDLPAQLESWTRMQVELAGNVAQILDSCRRVEVYCRQIAAAINPNDLDPEFAAKIIAESTNDPRNYLHPASQDASTGVTTYAGPDTRGR